MKSSFSVRWFLVAYLIVEGLLISVLFWAKQNSGKSILPIMMWAIFLLLFISIFFSVRLFCQLVSKMEEDAHQQAFELQVKMEHEHILATMKAEEDMARLKKKLKVCMQEEGCENGDEGRWREKIDVALDEERDSLFINYCPNHLVDSLLYHKALKMKEGGIEHSIVAAIPKELALDDFVLVSVLTNLIDNAIEATLSLDHERKIDIHLFVRANVLVCKVDNTVLENVSIEKGRSTKKEKMKHGLGLLIIENACRKHGGLFSQKIEDGWCKSTAMLCLDRENEVDEC